MSPWGSSQRHTKYTGAWKNYSQATRGIGFERERKTHPRNLYKLKKKGKFHDDLNYTYNFGFQCLIFSFFSLPISTYSQKPKKYGEAVAYLELYRTKYMHQIRRGV